jgi:hypothetical protein
MPDVLDDADVQTEDILANDIAEWFVSMVIFATPLVNLVSAFPLSIKS